jgi:hypothetical protein
MVYAPPILSVLATSVSRDLRDPTNKTFTLPEVKDFIRSGVVEVSSVSPIESIETISFVADTAAYACGLIDAFRVEVVNDNGYVGAIQPNTSDDVGAQGGWDLFAGLLHVPWVYASRLNPDTNDSFRVWGYRPRVVPTLDNEVLDGDAAFEQGVRTYALLEGYQRLVNSRSLFQQWTQSPGNSDVSPTQLAGFATNYEQQWQRMRQQMRRLRRR